MKRIYYGWTMLFLIALAQVSSWGILYYSFPVFITPMHDDLGWSTAELTGAYSLALLLAGLCAVPVGHWLDRHGPRTLMTLGTCLGCLLVLAWSVVEQLWVFYLIWAGIGIATAATFYEPAFQVVAVWFDRRRASALTLLTFVGGFASVIYIPLTNRLVTSQGWRDTLVVLAIILLVATLPIHAFALRKRPGDLGLEPDGARSNPSAHSRPSDTLPAVSASSALRDPAFWWLATTFVLAMLATMAMTVYLIPFLIQQGYSPRFAAGAAGLIGLFALPGRLIFTPLGSRIPRRYVTATIFAVQTLSLVVLVLAQSTQAVFVFVALFGAGFGAITPARAGLVAELYGAASYGSINGVMALSITVSRAAAPIGAGMLSTAVGYTPMLWMLVLASALASLAALQVKPRGDPMARPRRPFHVSRD